MKTKYDIDDHVLTEVVIEQITVQKNGTFYRVRAEKAKEDWGPTYLTTPASLIIKEDDLKQKPEEFNGCDNCKHDRVPMTAYPCSDCEHNHISHYEPKEDEDVIDE